MKESKQGYHFKGKNSIIRDDTRNIIQIHLRLFRTISKISKLPI